MKVIVITGSTRGIGFGLAREFLAQDCAVVISGRTQPAVDRAVAALIPAGDVRRVTGIACNTCDLDQVQALWDSAVRTFGRVDIWINNAGISRGAAHIEDIPAADVHMVIETNILGAIHGAVVALRGMRAQGAGAIYNMEGLGSDGMRLDGQHMYGLTKRALAYLTDSLADEVSGSRVIVGALRPGMMITDMIIGQYENRPAEWEKSRAILEAISEKVEVVAPVLVSKILANTRNGARLKFGGAWQMVKKLPKIIAARRSVRRAR
jgi:NAD(P)-dependent dehydrogenase (short-subunit alcohol dehydrogenase family)